MIFHLLKMLKICFFFFFFFSRSTDRVFGMKYIKFLTHYPLDLLLWRGLFLLSIFYFFNKFIGFSVLFKLRKLLWHLNYSKKKETFSLIFIYTGWFFWFICFFFFTLSMSHTWEDHLMIKTSEDYEEETHFT